MTSHPNSHPTALGQADSLPSSRSGIFSALHSGTPAVIYVPVAKTMAPENPLGLGNFCCCLDHAQSCICKNEDGQQRVHEAHCGIPSQRSSFSLAGRVPSRLVPVPYPSKLPRFSWDPHLHKRGQLRQIEMFSGSWEMTPMLKPVAMQKPGRMLGGSQTPYSTMGDQGPS